MYCIFFFSVVDQMKRMAAGFLKLEKTLVFVSMRSHTSKQSSGCFMKLEDS